MGLVCFGACNVAVGFVAIVKVGAAANHVIGEGVATLTCDGYVGVGVDAAHLVAKIHDSYTCPETIVANMLIWLVESAIQADAWHGLQLG